MNVENIKVLITGANGQLGQELVHVAPSHMSIIALSKAELNITSISDCRRALHEYKPHVVIHCAAYTAVDKAESDKDSAFLVNDEGSKNIAIASEEVGAKLVYISTDYVFDGKAQDPYEIDELTNPQTIYGLTKLAGELAIKQYHSRYFIVRTSWVFGRYGQNFVKTMLTLAKQHQSLNVVNDQMGSPTYTYDLAHFLYELIQTEKYGVYHATNSGQCTWYEFAQAIFNLAKIEIEVNPCSTEQFPRPAKRPAYSVLSPNRIKEQGFTPIQHWQLALKHMLDHYYN